MVDSILRFLANTNQRKVGFNDVAQIMRIVYESMAMKYREAIQDLAFASMKTITKICIIGGGCKNQILNQFTASVTGLEVFAGPIEATSIGNIIFQAYGIGKMKEEDITELIDRSFKINRYYPRDRRMWDREYDRFRTLMKE